MLESAAAEAAYSSPWKGTRQDILATLELLPCMAFLASEGCVTAQNQLAAAQTGLAQAEPVVFERIFLGAFPTTVTETSGTDAAKFECILIRQNALPVAIHGAVRTIGPDMRLIVALERVDSEVAIEAPQFGNLLDSAPEAMAITHDGRLLHVNREFTRLFGYEPGVCVGQDIDALLMPEGRMHENEILYHMVATEGRAAIETVRHTQSGVAIPVSVLVAPVALSGSAMGLFHTFRDIRRQKEQESRLLYSAMHDPLTGLPNRALFLDRLRLTLARLQRRPERHFAVLFLDLDHFKAVNDSLGHAAGDALLLDITHRLHDCVRPQDTVARFGGDEFAVLLDEVGSSDDICRVADRIQAAVQKPVALEGHVISVSVSIGVAVVTPEYRRADDVVRAADMAMYMAKVAGKAQHAFAPPVQGGGATIQPCLASEPSQQPA